MNKVIEVLAFIKEIIADEAKMAKFREVVTDIKDVVNFFKKDENVAK